MSNYQTSNLQVCVFITISLIFVQVTNQVYFNKRKMFNIVQVTNVKFKSCNLQYTSQKLRSPKRTENGTSKTAKSEAH